PNSQGSFKEVSPPGGRLASMPAAATATRSPRVLVVDDEENIRYLLVTALRHAEMDVVEAATGRQALDSAKDFRPDVLLLDVMLPDLDGFEVCRRLRSDGSAAPVIFLTARDATEDKV